MDLCAPEGGRNAAEAAISYHRHLLGMVGHELRNPLSVISMSTQLLRRGEPLAPAQERVLARIEDAAKRMKRLVADLLDSTLLESGQGISVLPRATHMAALCEEAVGDARLLHPSRTIHCEGSGDGAGCWDPDRILQVLTNLVSNALKYSPPDSPVHLRWRGVEGAVVVEVHNGGRPIPGELMPRLFDPFRRGTSEERTKGLGLGLFIAQGIAQGHGGTLEARSSEAEGSVFTLTLPRQPPALQPARDAAGEPWEANPEADATAAGAATPSLENEREKHMSHEQRITVTETDFTSLQRMLDHYGSGRDADFVAMLESELARAEVVPSDAVAPDVVTMNSTVVYEDTLTGARRQVRLVYPREARDSAECVSVLAPIGAALLGLRVGQSIEWPLPGGRLKQLRIVEVAYQPEAAGDAVLKGGQAPVAPAGALAVSVG